MIAELQTIDGGAGLPTSTKPERLFAIPEGDYTAFMGLHVDERERVKTLLAVFLAIHKSHNIKQACQVYSAELRSDNIKGCSWSNLRSKYFTYIRTGDWRTVANKVIARELVVYAFQKEREQFLAYWRKMGTLSKRVYAAAHRRMMKAWAKGESIPGFGTWREYWAKMFPEDPIPAHFPDLYPKGTSYRNLMDHKKKPTKAQEKAAREGIAAARNFLPHVKGTRETLRFLEEIEFDDIKTDFRIVITTPGKQCVCDLWLLIARDKATDLILGYGMRPALPREDGKQDHLRAIDMKQLVGWVLTRYGLPTSYTIKLKVERGSATLALALGKAIEQLSNGSIRVHWTSMIGGTVMPGGFKDKAIGNSRGKARLESGNNYVHNEADDLPGQTGSMYQRRPAELAAREAECRELFKLADRLSRPVYDRIQYPILTIHQARLELNRIFNTINSRTEHALEDFEDVVVWRNSLAEPWRPLVELPQGTTPALVETRKESPMERMGRLVAGVEFRPVQPAFFIHFYDDCHKIVTVNKDGEINFQHEGKDHTFMPPDGKRTIRAGEKFLAYFHPREIDFLHLTKPAPHTGYVATWVKRNRVRPGDHEALAAAIRYCKAAQETELNELRSWHGDYEVAENARRAHNAALLTDGGTPLIDAEDGAMIEVAPAPAQNSDLSPTQQSPVLTALQAIHVEQSKDAADRKAVREVDVVAILNKKASEPAPAAAADEYF